MRCSGVGAGFCDGVLGGGDPEDSGFAFGAVAGICDAREDFPGVKHDFWKWVSAI